MSRSKQAASTLPRRSLTTPVWGGEMDGPCADLATIVLDCRDANALADFYSRLLGWEISYMRKLQARNRVELAM
ncbi:MAG: hypothetical protein KY462_16530, partial [Actinobacteria bacterium]|nr:hypothetical protein [Actinomycetota bacterium]